MQVGRMRYRIEIQDYKSTQDADGFETREDRKSTRLNSSHGDESRMPSSA